MRLLWLKILTAKANLKRVYMEWHLKQIIAERDFYRDELIRMGEARWVQEKEKDAA